MKVIKTILTLVIGIAIGVIGYHFIRQHHPTASPAAGLKISHSSSDPERAAMETLFGHQYARLHKAKDLEGLLALGKFEGVWENIMSSKRGNLSRSFAQEITEFSFRELRAAEISELSDLSLPPVVEYRVSFAQPNPEVDRMQSYVGFLGVGAGRLYIVDRVKKQ
jgi:hypothetical protein